jgi:hypothetical protein
MTGTGGRLVAAAAVVMLAITALVMPAQALTLERSTAHDDIITDLPGRVIVQVRYEDLGPLGIRPFKLCAKDDPNALSRTLRVEWTYAGGEFDAEFKQADRWCKRIPDGERRLVTYRGWVAQGYAVYARIGGVDIFRTPFSLSGRMR